MGGEVNPLLAYSVFAPLCRWFGVTSGEGKVAVSAVTAACLSRASHNACDTAWHPPAGPVEWTRRR